MEIEKLKLVAVHRVEALKPWEQEDVWDELVPFDAEEDHPQLLASLFAAEPALTSERLKTAKVAELFVGTLEGVDEEPIERWDVVGPDDEAPRYQLWLFDGNRGALFEAGTTTLVGEIQRCIFRIVSEEMSYWDGEDLVRMLRAAHAVATRAANDTELAHVEF